MQIRTDGLIIKEKLVSEDDKLVTILTRNFGIIRAFAQSVKNLKNKNFSSTQLLCYSDFIIFKGRNKYIINESYSKHSFWSLRCNIEKLALAQYFCDLILNLIAEEQHHTEDILRLILNSLYYLSKEKIVPKLLKSTFEMRILSMSGYMPNLIYCSNCKDSGKKNFYFVPEVHGIVCDKCIRNYRAVKIKLTESVLYALRYSVYSEFNKMFAFSLKLERQDELSAITESYILKCLEKNLKTLDFYKQVVIN